MYPRQVQQYIGRKLGEFYDLLLARGRRSIVLSLEEDLNTTKLEMGKALLCGTIFDTLSNFVS